MSLLDRYIARQYVINAVVLLVILCSFVVAIDVALNLSRYWNSDYFREMGEGGASGVRRAAIVALLVADLWWPRLLNLYNLLIGLVLVGAMGFTCAQLVRHRELVAVLTSGRSLQRCAWPFVGVALGFTVLQGINQEVVIPRIAPLLTRDQGDAGKRTLGASRVPPVADSQGRLYYAKSFDADAGVLEDLYVWEREAGGLTNGRIHAARARWRDGGWDLEGAAREGVNQASGGVVEVPSRLVTDLDPTLLKIRRFANFGSNISWSQARRMASRMEGVGGGEAAGADSDQTRRTRDLLARVGLGRMSGMLSNLLALVIALSFFLVREPQGMVGRALRCAPVSMAALVGGTLGTTAPIPGVPAAVSVFIPVMVLLPIAAGLWSRVRS
ncbi:MAG: LptF/LptG family permease [Phycisphaerae bacterium]|nr:LptF/LptG family permease [Phycisphaerae bacterium]